jgi:type IV secretion system protein VirB6
MRQVMPMAAGLASGLALSSFGLVSAALVWGLSSAARGTGQFGRGLMDTDTSRRDPLARQAGYALRRGLTRVVSRSRENQIRRRA